MKSFPAKTAVTAQLTAAQKAAASAKTQADKAIAARDEAGKIAEANGTPYGLAGAVWAGDEDVLRKVRTDLEAAGKGGAEADIRRQMLEPPRKALVDLAGRVIVAEES